MAQLAILGHSTRGSEVIALLEILGGKNTYNLTGTKERWYILSNGIIEHSTYLFEEKGFTLEEFLEKFPYKVGDKVSVYEYESKVRINDMKWDGFEIQYSVFTDETEWYSAEELNKCNEPCKEETKKTITIDDFKANTKEWLIDNLHGMIISDVVKTIGNIHDELHKPKYPKTYVECAKILNCFSAAYIDGYKNALFEKLQELIICRDAYWKIAGEQMGLGKPWEPDWLNA